MNFRKNLSAMILRAVAIAVAVTVSIGLPAAAETYTVDTPGMHAFVQFRVKHLGYSWLYGRFNKFEGEFSYDPAAPGSSAVSMTIDTTSLDTNHAERDKHLRSDDFLDTDQYPTATFETTGVDVTGEDSANIVGNLTLHGVTNEITIAARYIGGGDDPWGGFRRGFEGTATLRPDDYGIEMVKRLGPASGTVELILAVEGVRQK